jgi:hypothetical protein
MTLNNVLRMVHFLTGAADKAMQQRLLSTVKHEITINSSGKTSSYNFNRQDLWESFFTKDGDMKRIMENRRIASIDDLEMRTWVYMEDHKGRAKGPLF